MPPHKVEYDSTILKILDSTSVEILGYRPWINFTDLLRRVEQIHPEVTDITLERHLNKLLEQGRLIKYGPRNYCPNGKKKLARKERVFYRINPGDSVKQRQVVKNSFYDYLSRHKSKGHVVESKHTDGHIYTQINCRPTFPLYSYDIEQELFALRDFLLDQSV